MSKLENARSELAKLLELQSEQAAKVEALCEEIESCESALGARVLAGLQNGAGDPAGLASRELADLRARLEAEEAGADALESAITEGKRTVKRAESESWRAESAKLRAELEKHNGQVAVVLAELRDLEESSAIRFENYAAPVCKSGRIAARAQWLETCADRQDAGIPVMPYQEPWVATLPQ